MFEVTPIAPVDPAIRRPFWSVMIPSCGKSPYLAGTLASVLAEIGGDGDDFQLAVIENLPPESSSNVDATIAAIAPGYPVEVYRNERFLSMAENWTRGIEHSRGHFVHILHDDDCVLPGFYRELRRLIAASSPEYGFFSCSVCYGSDENHPDGCWKYPDKLYRGRATIADFAVENYLSAPAVVVRRSCYEAVGGFVARFGFAADYEMWCRLICRYRVAVLEKPFFFYRWHPNNATHRIKQTGQDVIEALALLDEYHRDGVCFPYRFARLSRLRFAWKNYRIFTRAGNAGTAARCHQIFRSNCGPGGALLIRSGFFDLLLKLRRIPHKFRSLLSRAVDGRGSER